MLTGSPSRLGSSVCSEFAVWAKSGGATPFCNVKPLRLGTKFFHVVIVLCYGNLCKRPFGRQDTKSPNPVLQVSELLFEGALPAGDQTGLWKSLNFIKLGYSIV